ncbi:MAG: MFS transporter [Candidatus Eisenbacteria bacterium]|nr:MFS transporter [Candidatus Eisenbacteria bacterium]
MSRPLFGRIFLSAGLFDGSFYMVGTLVPLKAVALGASAFQLGLMPVLGAGSYILAALLGGHLSDRWPRITMARWGAALRAAVTLLLFLADTTPHLLAVLPLFGMVNGLFWPGLQAALPSLATRRRLGALVGQFNVSWSAGKMLGYAVGGVLVDRIGYGLPIWIATIGGGAPALLLPSERDVARSAVAVAQPAGGAGGSKTASGPGPGPGAGPGPEPASAAEPTGATDPTDSAADMSSVSPERAIAWRRIGWTANFLLFGVGATLNYHYPKLLDGLGLGGTEFGVFLGLAYLVQTLTFFLFSHWDGWHYRSGWLFGAEVSVALALFLLPRLSNPWLIWALAPAVGLGLGFAYSGSLFYSLVGPGAHGRSTGLHEAILASGSFLLPFLAGVGVRMTGNLHLPYLFVAAVVLVGVCVQAAWLGRIQRSGPMSSFPTTS